MKGHPVTTMRRNFADISLPRRDEILSVSAFCRAGWSMDSASPWTQYETLELDIVEHHGSQVTISYITGFFAQSLQLSSIAPVEFFHQRTSRELGSSKRKNGQSMYEIPVHFEHFKQVLPGV